ncbi:MAG: homocysteine S-methyltransferase family protein, partial [Chloroflexi bacterium]|nr:homocysteine S-methyltransferase family protein [Chloroflexota bacterium]
MVLPLSERLSRGLLLCDGATGTQLYEHGLTNALPEPANIEQPDIVKGVHLSYLRAGAELIETNTFGANAVKLGTHGMASRVEELNRAGVALAKEAARLHGQTVWVAGSMGPLPPDATGAGLFSPASAWNVFAEQAAALSDAGADLILLETFTSLTQLRQAIEAVQSVSELPVMAQMTFTGDGLTPGGDSPEDVVAALKDAGLLALGANCSVGPDLLLSVDEHMSATASVPLIVQPNAGLPAYVGGRLQYAASQEYFAETAREIARAGASAIGGCCGTTPAHIAAVRDAVRGVLQSSTRRSATPSRAPAQRVEAPAAPPTGLAERITQGAFVVTVELAPPRGFDVSGTLDKIRGIAGSVDAVNVADSPRAQGRMSALATGSLVQSRLGVEAVMHMAIRHRNLLALHSDLL